MADVLSTIDEAKSELKTLEQAFTKQINTIYQLVDEPDAAPRPLSPHNMLHAINQRGSWAMRGIRKGLHLCEDGPI